MFTLTIGFVISVEGIFLIIFYYYYGKENRSSYRGVHYIEALYIEVPTVLLKVAP